MRIKLNKRCNKRHRHTKKCRRTMKRCSMKRCAMKRCAMKRCSMKRCTMKGG